MTPFASVAMLEKFALLKIALCRAPVCNRASVWRTSLFASTASATLLSAVGTCPRFCPDSLAPTRRPMDGGGSIRRQLERTLPVQGTYVRYCTAHHAAALAFEPLTCGLPWRRVNYSRSW